MKLCLEYGPKLGQHRKGEVGLSEGKESLEEKRWEILRRMSGRTIWLLQGLMGGEARHVSWGRM